MWLAVVVLILLAVVPEAHAAALKEEEKTTLYIAGLVMGGVVLYLGFGKLWQFFTEKKNGRDDEEK
jgi:membrane protease YdiL (CAAX protease family)